MQSQADQKLQGGHHVDANSRSRSRRCLEHLGMIGFQCKRDRLAMVAIAWVAKESNACVGTVALLLA